ncbi:hypothetical protein OG756_02110 [Streptomyces sp. NBC_01310]|uniref:hypothetical protein n=1 Tax=Streptomyces sp. NBC_01310 TaxID=2903820 RepID=UPI0035B5FB5D|nr:hypothetical protein OG756_02110 [Streptomyces sp. NBC_01310]
MARTGLDRLEDVDGQPVRMDLRRLRKSVKSRQYLRSGGFLPDFVQGHTREVAARHESAIEEALTDAAAVALAPPTVLDEAGHRLDDGPAVLTQAEVAAAEGGESDVFFLASCRDFYTTPWASAGTACPVAFWGCLECPNAVFTLRHLPSILGFLDFVERQREELTAPAWQARYGLAWQRIVEGIHPKFTDAQIAEAAAIAEAGGDRLALPTAFLTTLATRRGRRPAEHNPFVLPAAVTGHIPLRGPQLWDPVWELGPFVPRSYQVATRIDFGKLPDPLDALAAREYLYLRFNRPLQTHTRRGSRPNRSRSQPRLASSGSTPAY